MSDRLLLIDTDMLVLLGGSGTLADVISSLGFAINQCRRLAAATHQLQRGRAFKDAFQASVLQAALRTAQTIAPLSEATTDPGVLDALAQVSDIDPGEAGLLAMLSEHSGCYLSTGDKRALVALATRKEVAEVRRRVSGRVICLESVLRLLVVRNGASAMAHAFQPLRTHRTIAILLSDPQTSSQEVCLQGIDSYLNALLQQTGDGFLHLP